MQIKSNEEIEIMKQKIKKENHKSPTIYDDENNEAPATIAQIKIVENKLNDSFEADFEFLGNGKMRHRKRKPKVKSKPFTELPLSPSKTIIKSPSSPMLDDKGEPVLNLRPMLKFYQPPSPTTSSGEVARDTTNTHPSSPKTLNTDEKEINEADVVNTDDQPFVTITRRKKRLQKSSSNESDASEVVEKKVLKCTSPTHSSSRTMKYFAQRYRLFTKFDQGIQMDEESW